MKETAKRRQPGPRDPRGPGGRRSRRAERTPRRFSSYDAPSNTSAQGSEKQGKTQGVVVALDLLVQGLDVDPEQTGRLHLLAPGLREDSRDVDALHLREGGGTARGPGRGAARGAAGRPHV